MTTVVSIYPATITQGETEVVEFRMALTTSSNTNHIWRIRAPNGISPAIRYMIQPKNFTSIPSSVGFEVDSDITTGTKSFIIETVNTNAQRELAANPIPPSSLQLSVNAVPLPTASGVNVSFITTTSELRRRDFIYLIMSLINPSDDAFEFRLTDSGGAFDMPAPFIIQGTEEVRMFIQAGETATERSGIIEIESVNDAAEVLDSFLTANTYSYTVLPAIPPIPAKNGSVEQPTISNANGETTIHPGDVIRVRIRLVNADLGDYRFYLTQNARHFDFGDDQLHFGFEEGESEITLLVQTDPATITSIVNGQFTLHPASDDARDILPGTEGFTVQITPTPIPIVPSATGVSIDFSPSGSGLVAGDYVYLTMSLPGATDDEFVFSLFDTSNEFETAQPITIQGGEILNTFFRVKANARLGSSELVILGENRAARALERFFTDARNTYSYTVIDTTPNAESVNIEFLPSSPSELIRGDFIYLEMSLVNPSDDAFAFDITDDANLLIGDATITIHGNETVRTFFQVRDNAEFGFSRISISPTLETARHITNLLSATGFYELTIVPQRKAPPAPTFDLDDVRKYFEQPFFDPTLRLPSQDSWTSVHHASGDKLVLTNARVFICGKMVNNVDVVDEGFYQIPFVEDGAPSEQFLAGVDMYPGGCWFRLSIRDGASQQVSLGDKPKYRFTGVAFFQIFIKQGLSSKQAREIHSEIAKYILCWKSMRKQDGDYGNVSVRAPASTFGIDSGVDGWTQSNLNFPFTYDASI